MSEERLTVLEDRVTDQNKAPALSVTLPETMKVGTPSSLVLCLDRESLPASGMQAYTILAKSAYATIEGGHLIPGEPVELVITPTRASRLAPISIELYRGAFKVYSAYTLSEICGSSARHFPGPR